jgi:hypothetical protein
MSANVQRFPTGFAKVSGETSLWLAMSSRVRHCIECPKCFTRYLVGFSPYRNGSYLVPIAKGSWEGWTLYCSCGSPYRPSRWGSDELRPYEVSNIAHHRGFGPPDEIVALRRR